MDTFLGVKESPQNFLSFLTVHIELHVQLLYLISGIFNVYMQIKIICSTNTLQSLNIINRRLEEISVERQKHFFFQLMIFLISQITKYNSLYRTQIKESDNHLNYINVEDINFLNI